MQTVAPPSGGKVGPMRRANLLLLVLVSPLLAATTRADVVYLAGGRRVKCVVVREDDRVVVINTFNSRHPNAVLGTETHPREQVKKIVREVDPLQECRRREPKATTVEDLLALAAYCEEHKLKTERRRVLLRAFTLDPENEAVRREVSPSGAERESKADPTLNPELRTALARYLEEEDAGARKAARAELDRLHGYDPGDLYLERAWRSSRAPRGFHADRPIKLRAREIKAVYTLLVPENYDPFRSYPLIVGLHGGGAGGKEGDMVVGSGRAAMQKFGPSAKAREWIAVCPTAVTAGWGAKVNQDLVLTLIEEIGLTYNVDLNRIYLIGHSMGGFGTFAIGPEYAERFAAIAPMSGGGRGGSMKRLKDSATPIYVYHSADDPVCGVGGSRGPAESLQKMEADFVYTETQGHGHGIAPGVTEDIFEFFAVRALARGKGRRFLPTHEPDPSFLAKVSRDEKAYLGDPLESTPDATSGDKARKQLLRKLALGGGSASEAADDLIALADPKSVDPLGDIAAKAAVDDDIRVQACRVLGRIGGEDSVKPLSAALRAESWRVRDAAAAALGVLGSAKGFAPLLRSLDAEWTEFDSKRIQGNRFHYSDWEVCLGAFGIRARSLASIGDPSAVAPIRRIVIERVLGGDWDPAASARAGQDASRPPRALGIAVAEAIEKLGGDDAKPAIEALMAAMQKDSEVVGRCRSALEALAR